jgi:hypothetical protein
VDGLLSGRPREGRLGRLHHHARNVHARGKELLVWLAYHNGGDEATTADFMPQIAEIARQSGCFRVAIESPRPYHRAVPGMKLARHVFHYEV